jgi:hypothetical protein
MPGNTNQEPVTASKIPDFYARFVAGKQVNDRYVEAGKNLQKL